IIIFLLPSNSFALRGMSTEVTSSRLLKGTMSSLGQQGGFEESLILERVFWSKRGGVQFKAVLFDLDGTLTDTEKIHTKAWEEIVNNEFKAHKETKDRVFDIHTDLDYVKGIPPYDGALNFFSNCGIKEFECLRGLRSFIDKDKNHEAYEKLSPMQHKVMDNIGRLAAKKEEHYMHYIKKHPEEVVLIPGAKELLRQLKAEGKLIAIVSSSIPVREVLEAAGLNGFVDVVVTGGDVGSYCSGLGRHMLGKPQPDPYIAGARELGVSEQECIGFEDSKNGAKALIDAGIVCIQVGLGPEGKFDCADFVVNTLREVSVSAQGFNLREKLSSLDDFAGIIDMSA
ncbi:MAG: HAD family phosphatase, partial [Candidatus Omnitrophota bacterium]